MLRKVKKKEKKLGKKINRLRASGFMWKPDEEDGALLFMKHKFREV